MKECIDEVTERGREKVAWSMEYGVKKEESR